MPLGDPPYENVVAARARARKLVSGPRWGAPGLVVVAILLLAAASLAADDAGAPAWEPWAYVLVALLLTAVAAWNVLQLRRARQFLEAWPEEEAPDRDPDTP